MFILKSLTMFALPSLVFRYAYMCGGVLYNGMEMSFAKVYWCIYSHYKAHIGTRSTIRFNVHCGINSACVPKLKIIERIPIGVFRNSLNPLCLTRQVVIISNFFFKKDISISLVVDREAHVAVLHFNMYLYPSINEYE